jgi:8-oxo-dGTP pyrophosphatase MutT (NUDIX family)
MHRNALLADLDGHKPYDAHEAESLARMIRFVETHPDCFERSLSIGHMTAAAWLLEPTGKRVLLTHHKKLDRWLQLGGHADGCCDLRDVAIREAREESGIRDIEFVSTAIFDVDVHRIPARGVEPEHDHYDVRFLLRVTGDTMFRVSDESHALAWFTPDELAGLATDDSVQRMCMKWRDQELLTLIRAGRAQPPLTREDSRRSRDSPERFLG